MGSTRGTELAPRAKNRLVLQAESLGFGDETLILMAEREGRMLDWNQRAEKTYGYSREEAIGRITHELFSTVFPEPLDKIEEKVMEYGHWKGELVHKLRSGSEIVVDSRWVLDPDHQGIGSEPVLLEINIDKTAKVREDRRVRRQEHVFFQILDSIRSGSSS